VRVGVQVVVDTSVLVTDPESMFSYPGCDVVIPLTVLEELDDLKTRPDEVGRAARTAVRMLEELRLQHGGDLASRVPVGDAGGTLRIEINGLQLDRLEALRLPVEKEDNRILACALGLANEHETVRLVSADGALRIKAAALGVQAEDYERPSRHRDELVGGGRPVVLDVPGVCVSLLYDSDHEVSVVDLLSTGALTGEAADMVSSLTANEAVILKAGSASVLARMRHGALRQVRTEQHAWGLRPRSKEQHFALDLLLDEDVSVVALTGHAGVGKTLLALAAGLEQVFEPTSNRYDRLMILRPVVAVGRQELGFLPGDLESKLGPWFEAVVDAMVALGDNVSHRQAKDIIGGWVHEGKLTLEAVTYLRGRSLQHTYVLVDEVQNLEPSVAKTILTRLGQGSKAVLVGDTTQIDSPFLSERTNALSVLADSFAGEELFGHVALMKGERSAIADLAAARL
jgi:PhoH-like ATPase